jgi:retinol dehydrogenase-12
MDITLQTRCLVTGATSGLGYETSLALARAGADLVIHGRSAVSVESTAARLLAEVPGAKLTCVHADLGDPVAVAALVAQLPEGRFDLLVNNAGAAFGEFGLNAAGIERTVWINHIAPLLLTKAMLPRIADDGLVVTVSSAAIGYVSVAVDQTDFSGGDLSQGYTQLRAYGISKLYGLAAMRAFARNQSGGPKIILVDPGGIQTDFARKGGEKAFLEMTLAHWDDCLPAEECARQLLAAVARSDLAPGGLYHNGEAIDIPASAHGDAFADRALAATEKLIASL